MISKGAFSDVKIGVGYLVLYVSWREIPLISSKN